MAGNVSKNVRHPERGRHVRLVPAAAPGTVSRDSNRRLLGLRLSLLNDIGSRMAFSIQHAAHGMIAKTLVSLSLPAHILPGSMRLVASGPRLVNPKQTLL